MAADVISPEFHGIVNQKNGGHFLQQFFADLLAADPALELGEGQGLAVSIREHLAVEHEVKGATRLTPPHHRLTGLDQLTRGEVAAVAGTAHPQA